MQVQREALVDISGRVLHTGKVAVDTRLEPTDNAVPITNSHYRDLLYLLCLHIKTQGWSKMPMKAFRRIHVFGTRCLAS